MTSCVSFLDLPAEILEFIIFKHSLKYSDVVNIQSCCRYLHDLIQRNDVDIWKSKFLQRYRSCLPAHNHKQVRNWRALYCLRETWGQRITDDVLKATELLLHKDEAPRCIIPAVIAPWQELCNEEFTLECVVDALFHLCTPREEQLLSLQYYALKLVEVVHAELLTMRWETMVDRAGGINNVPLCQGIGFVDRRCRPEHDSRAANMEDFIHCAAQKVVDKLKVNHNDMADRLVSTLNDFTFPPPALLWTPKQQDLLMKTSVDVVIAELEEMGGSLVSQTLGTIEGMFTSPHSHATAMIALLLSVCVAERLAVTYRLLITMPPRMGFTCQFPSDIGEDGEIIWSYLFPVSNNLTVHTSEANSNRTCIPNTLYEVLAHYVEVAVPLVRTSAVLQLKAYLSPENSSHNDALIYYYLRNQINIQQAKELCLKQGNKRNMEQVSWMFDEMEEDELAEPEMPVKTRSDLLHTDVRYGVGMIMSHVRYGYACVITGWTETCAASQVWIQQMGVDMLPLGPNQPFYNVLVEDGSERYAAQENLQPHQTPVRINNWLVGKFMKAFEGNHYTMNHAVEKYYPDDKAFIAAAVAKHYG